MLNRKLPEALRQSLAAFIEEHYTPPIQWQVAKNCSMPTFAEPLIMDGCSTLSLEDALKAVDIGFSEALLKQIDESGKKDSEIYKRANISKQHFSKIRNNPNYKPTKATALALCIALELDVEQTKELIGRAGFALTNSSKSDLIIRYFIEQRKYDIVEVNIALYEFDQSLLGG